MDIDTVHKHLQTLNTIIQTHKNFKKMKRIDIKGTVMKLAATGGGAVAAASLNKIAFMKSITNPIERGAIKVALGAFGPQFLGKGKMKGIFDSFGDGMIAVGAIEIANGTLFKSAPVSVSGVLPVLNGNMWPVETAANDY